MFKKREVIPAIFEEVFLRLHEIIREEKVRFCQGLG